MKTSTPKGISDTDLRAAQELKNERDFKYETNQSLQSLSQRIAEIAVKNDKAHASYHNDRKALLIELENLKELVIDSLKQMGQRLGDAESKLLEIQNSLADFKEQIEMGYLTKESFATRLAPEYRKIDLLERDMTLKNDYFNLAIYQLKQHFKDQLEVVRKDLTPVVPEIDPVDEKLNERFKVFKVDFDGLVREIAILKREVAYDQKKFENIYTLIERFKERNP